MIAAAARRTSTGFGCGLKLIVDHLAAVDGAFGQDPDRRDVGQGKVCGEE